MWSVLEFYARFLALTPLSRMVHRGHSVNELISARFVAPAERPKKEREREGAGQTQETHTCLLSACVWVCVRIWHLVTKNKARRHQNQNQNLFLLNSSSPISGSTSPSAPLPLPLHSVAACLIIYVALIEFCSPQKGQLKLLKKAQRKI